MNQLVSIAQTSLYPMIEGAIKYTIPLTLITFVLGLILAVLTALARLSIYKNFTNNCACICVNHPRDTFTCAIIYYFLWTSKFRCND